MKLKSKKIFDAVKKEYPNFSTAEIIAFVKNEYLSQIAENMTMNAGSEGDSEKLFNGQAYMGGLS